MPELKQGWQDLQEWGQVVGQGELVLVLQAGEAVALGDVRGAGWEDEYELGVAASVAVHLGEWCTFVASVAVKQHCLQLVVELGKSRTLLPLHLGAPNFQGEKVRTLCLPGLCSDGQDSQKQGPSAQLVWSIRQSPAAV